MMYAHIMVNESKGKRIYFRVTEPFKKRFEAAARLVEKDSSELFRHIASEFIDRLRAERPREFEKLMAQDTTETQDSATNSLRGRVPTDKAGRSKTSQGRNQKQGGQ